MNKIFFIYALLIIFGTFVYYVKANKGIFGYDAFATYEWQITPDKNVTECVEWGIESTGDNLEDHYASITIKPGCTNGIVLKDTSKMGFFAPFQYYSELQIDLIVVEGKLDIRLEEPDSDIYTVIESLDASEFTDEEKSSIKFTNYNIPFPEEQEGELSILNFSNPSSEKTLTFYMRKARLIYITPRTILDDLKLYGDDWSYNVINSTFTGNVFYKFLKPVGCISINIRNPYIGPWASVRFDIIAPPDLNLYVGLEIEGDMVLRLNGTEYLESNGIILNEEEWITLEMEYSEIIYDILYDRLDICNDGPNISWMKVRNIYFEPVKIKI